MGTNSKIEWTNHTWNPWQGCQKVSPGCKFCYMYRDKNRYGQDPKNVHRSSDATFNKPLRWKDPAFVFTCSWSDFFIEEADGWRYDAFDIIRQTPHLTYQILTKRIDRVQEWIDSLNTKTVLAQKSRTIPAWTWPTNAWLGVSVENQEMADLRIPLLMRTKIGNAIKFLSVEPMIGPVSLHELPVNIDDIDWIISGGESGLPGKCRPHSLDWFRGLRDECEFYHIEYFHKQHGGIKKINGVWGGRMLDGRTHDDIPANESVSILRN